MSLWKWLSIYLVAVCPVKWVEIRYCVQEIHFIVHLEPPCISSTWSFPAFCSLCPLLYSHFAATFFRFVKLLSVNCIRNNNSKICQFQLSCSLKVFDPSITCHIWMALFLSFIPRIYAESKWVWEQQQLKIHVSTDSPFFYCDANPNPITRNWITVRARSIRVEHCECCPAAAHNTWHSSHCVVETLSRLHRLQNGQKKRETQIGYPRINGDHSIFESIIIIIKALPVNVNL